MRPLYVENLRAWNIVWNIVFFFLKGNKKGNSYEKILSIALNKSENLLVCITKTNRIYKIDLNNQLIYNNKILNFELKKNFHHSIIIDYGVSLQKPYILTGGKDNSIKLWNYETGQLELNKQLAENLNSISISPNGFYVLVSFYNKVNMYLILMDDFKCIKTFDLSKI